MANTPRKSIRLKRRMREEEDNQFRGESPKPKIYGAMIDHDNHIYDDGEEVLIDDDIFKFLIGNANPELGAAIAKRLLINPTQADITRFSDMEIFIKIKDNVRGKDVFILQPTCFPANDNLMELLILVDAVRRGSASSITAVIPYFGYARQDRKSDPRTPISARLVADLLEKAGVDRVLTVDLHASQIQGFFTKPVDNLFTKPVLIEYLEAINFPTKDLMVVSPDVGGVARARSFAEAMGCELSIIDKRRPKAGVSEVMNVIGNVEGRVCILIDDIVDTAGTLCHAATALKNHGATKVYAFAAHGVLSGGAIGRIMNSDIEKMFVTDSIPAVPSVKVCPKIEIISLADILARAVLNTYRENSISVLF